MKHIISIIIIACIGIGIATGAWYVADYNNKLGPYLHSLDNSNPLPDGTFPNPPELEISPTFS